MKSFRYIKYPSNDALVAKTMAASTTSLKSIARPRGAALIMAMLITLVLSGLGLIALHAVNDTTWKTANYRSRQQASQVSDSVANLAVYRLGDAGNSYVQFMHKAFDKERKLATVGSANANITNSDLLRRGPYLIFAQSPETGSTEHNINYLFTGKDADSNTVSGGIFDDSAKPSDRASSFSDNGTTSPLKVNYRFIIRDELDGPPAIGFDRSHCFKKVTVASHSHITPKSAVAESDRAWNSKTNNASNRNMIETMIGPIPCGEK